MMIRRLFISALLLVSTASIAEPAPWYWWISQFDGSRACSQTPMGEGWVREPTPFRDAICRVRLYKQ